jgi:hypothetical protein
MLISTPLVVALATMPRAARTTMTMVPAMQRSRSAGLRIRCSRRSVTRTGGACGVTAGAAGPGRPSGGWLGRGIVTDRSFHLFPVGMSPGPQERARFRQARECVPDPRDPRVAIMSQEQRDAIDQMARRSPLPAACPGVRSPTTPRRPVPPPVPASGAAACPGVRFPTTPRRQAPSAPCLSPVTQPGLTC